ncbi:MAG: ceramidase domain-containing protein [Gammaproteobacteria bacterium]
MLWLPALPQDPGYHQFADQRSLLGVGHFFNVMTNMPFIAVGLLGLSALSRPNRPVVVDEMMEAYRLFFAGIIGVGIGSGYYHMSPANETLIWDRFPMTVAFMAFFTIILAEYVSIKLAGLLFYPLVFIGLVSAGYWYWTELQGLGDLRLYGLVQLLPLLLIPLIILLYPGKFSHGYFYWLFAALYISAKVFEWYDIQIYRVLGGISGHSLKHLMAGLGCAVFLVQLINRHRIEANGGLNERD